MEKLNRNYQLDNLKAFLIFLVVAGHCMEYYISESPVLKLLYLFIYSFHMPLFVFVSGYFSKNLDKAREKAFSDIFILYLIFNTLYYIVKSIINHKIGYSLVIPGWTLWYLLSLFTWRILLKDLIKIRFILPLSLLLYLVVGCFSGINSYLSLARTVSFLPFFLLGYYASEENLRKIEKFHISIPIVAIAVVVCVCFLIPNSFDTSSLWLSRSFQALDLNFTTGIFTRLLQLIASISVSIIILRIIPKNQISLTKIGFSTLLIYLLHPYLIPLLHKILSYFDHPHLRVVIILIAPFFIVGFLCLPIIERLFNFTVNKIKALILHQVR